MVAIDRREAGGRIVFANEAFLDLTGYTETDVVGQSLSFLRGENTDRETASLIDRAVGDGASARFEVLHHRRDGAPFWDAVELFPETDDDGKAALLLAMHRDATEERSLREALEEERRLNAELEHRMRNLFSTVQVIARTADDEDGTSDGLRGRLVTQFEALAAAHDLIFRSGEQRAAMGDIAAAVLSPFDPEGQLIERRDGGGDLAAKQTVSAALVLYELALLSAQEGALKARTPVTLSWEAKEEQIRLVWHEKASLPGPDRFGFNLVRTFVRSSRWQEAGIEEGEDGFIVRLSFRAG